VSHVFLDSPKPIAFAHRGGSVERENALSAFDAVRRLGFRYIETDVRACRDGTVFVFHDENLGRLTGHDRQLSELTSKEIGRLTLPGGNRIPTLREALQRFPELRFNIDLKHDAVVQPVVDLIEELGVQERVCVTAFSERRVAEARTLLGPTVCTGLGVAGIFSQFARALLLGGQLGGADGAAVIQIPYRWRGLKVVNPRVVEWAHQVGLAVHVWTLNDHATIEGALDAGVDGVMTDEPQLLREILLARGLWKA
jgi:glycerophosphoryl diester phosphodiesterase